VTVASRGFFVAQPEHQVVVVVTAAVRAACRRLHLPGPVEGEVKLYSGTVSGLAVQLPDWQ
jgi:hypothetical protein